MIGDRTRAHDRELDAWPERPRASPAQPCSAKRARELESPSPRGSGHRPSPSIASALLPDFLYAQTLPLERYEILYPF
jgi:hypothetical protein